MVEEGKSIFYYLTVLNENYIQPALPKTKGVEEAIVKGMYLLEADKSKSKQRVQLLGAGSILREVRAAAEILRKEFKVAADVWSVPSFNELRRDGLEVERWNRLHPTAKPKKAYVTECLEKTEGPVIASTDYMKLLADRSKSISNTCFLEATKEAARLIQVVVLPTPPFWLTIA